MHELFLRAKVALILFTVWAFASVSVLLSSCGALEPVLAHAVLPSRGQCVANGVTWRLRDGKQSWSAGCVEQRPYPGMVRPGHGG